MAGRRSKDKKLKDIEGSRDRLPGKTERAENLAHIPAQAPKIPDYFAENALLKAVWVDVVNDLDRLNRLTITDSGVVQSYCVALAEMEETSREIQFLQKRQEAAREEGKGRFTPEMAELSKAINKARAVRSKAMEQARKNAIEMGCTPASRSRVPSLLQADLFDQKKGKNSFHGFN